MAGETCWCCRDYGLTAAAAEDGVCAACAGRSPSACKTAHERAGGKTSSQRLLEAIEAREQVIPAGHCQRCVRPGTRLQDGVCTGPGKAGCEALQPPLIPITDVAQ
jgi:hypothetical protein